MRTFELFNNAYTTIFAICYFPLVDIIATFINYYFYIISDIITFVIFLAQLSKNSKHICLPI